MIAAGRPNPALMQALTHPALADRWARATARRTEILFSTKNGRFCLHAEPNGEGGDWLYGVLYVFDAFNGVNPSWKVVCGYPSMMMFNDQVWIGTAQELGADAIVESSKYAFKAPAFSRPTPPRSHTP